MESMSDKERRLVKSILESRQNAAMGVDPVKWGKHLREKLVRTNPENNKRELCVVDFDKTDQKGDITMPIMEDIVTGDNVYRAKVNSKDMDKEIAVIKTIPPIDTDNPKQVRDSLNKSFDIIDWFRVQQGYPIQMMNDFNFNFIFQGVGCNFHLGDEYGGCLFCFVDNKSNSGQLEFGSFVSADSVLSSFEYHMDKFREAGRDLRHIRSSGGEPTLWMDFNLELAELIRQEHGIKVGLQLDTNLTSGALVRELEVTGQYPTHVWERIAEYKPKILSCFKGTDDFGVQSLVQAKLSLEDQIFAFKDIVNSGVDIYPYIINPDPATVREFVEKMDYQIDGFLPKLHFLEIKMYTPTINRIKHNAQALKMNPDKAVEAFRKHWANNYEHSIEIVNDCLHGNYGVLYQDIPRTGIDLWVNGKNLD